MNGPAGRADGNVSAGGDGDDQRDDPRAQFRASVARIAAAGRLFAELPGHRRDTDTASHSVFIPLLNAGPVRTRRRSGGRGDGKRLRKSLPPTNNAHSRHSPARMAMAVV